VLRFPEIYLKAMVPVLKSTSSAKVSRNIPQGYGSKHLRMVSDWHNLGVVFESLTHKEGIVV
jgi:hypothetical protein